MELTAHQVETLKAALQAQLAAITDADASILSDYVIALLKSPGSAEELRAKCHGQLQDFLLDATDDFLTGLFHELAVNYGLAGVTSVTTTTAAAAPIKAASPRREVVASRTRSHSRSPVRATAVASAIAPSATSDVMEEDVSATVDRRADRRNDDEYRRRDERRRRFGDDTQPASAARDHDRSERPQRRRHDQQEQRDRTPYARGSGERRRGKCYDYEEKGFCTRGPECPFEHGQDRVVYSGNDIHGPPPMGWVDRGGRPEYGNEPRGGFRGGPRGGARGGFRGGRGGMMQYPHGPSHTPYIPAGPRNDGKLCITQIPADSCTVERVRAYFQKFGHILSVGVSPHTASALIEFATADEAQAALGSPEAPFGNRFVRTFWYNPAMDARKSQDTEFTSWKEGDAPQATRIELTPEERAHRQEEAARMRTALQTQMAELQRKQAEERQRIVANLEHLSEKERAEIMRSLSSVSHTIAATPQVLASTKKMTGGSGVMAAGQTPAVAGDEMNTDDAATAETPEALQARLAAVKAEHEALGLSAPGFCGRGRGRGRGAFRGGRGGGSMSLDLRPKKFAVHGFPADQAPAVAAHFQQFNGLESCELVPGGGAATVSFANRWLAEQAFLKASKLSPDVTLSFEWIANSTTGASPAPAGDDAMMEYDEAGME